MAPQPTATPLGLGLLATVAIVGLLLAFHQVVRGAVQQGEFRRQAMAVHADATWRCEALRGIGRSQACLVQLNASPVGGATAGATRPAVAMYTGR